jgi:hypothetical protein
MTPGTTSNHEARITYYNEARITYYYTILKKVHTTLSLIHETAEIKCL